MATKKNITTTKKKTSSATRKPDDAVEVVVSADIKQPGARRKRARKQTVKVLLETDDVVREQFGGFVGFVRQHAIVGLAVGFIVGQQAQGIIKQLVTSFIDPAFQLFFGKKLSERTFTLHVGDNWANFGWGGMIYVLLNLLFVLLVVYVLLKLFKLDKLDKKKEN